MNFPFKNDTIDLVLVTNIVLKSVTVISWDVNLGWAEVYSIIENTTGKVKEIHRINLNHVVDIIAYSDINEKVIKTEDGSTIKVKKAENNAIIKEIDNPIVREEDLSIEETDPIHRVKTLAELRRESQGLRVKTIKDFLSKKDPKPMEVNYQPPSFVKP